MDKRTHEERREKRRVLDNLSNEVDNETKRNRVEIQFRRIKREGERERRVVFKTSKTTRLVELGEKFCPSSESSDAVRTLWS